MYRKTYVEVDIDNLKNNVKNIVNYYNDYEYYFGVIKGNCYGHGTTYVINELIESGVNYLAVSTLEEALEVRKINKKIPVVFKIFLLNKSFKEIKAKRKLPDGISVGSFCYSVQSSSNCHFSGFS